MLQRYSYSKEIKKGQAYLWRSLLRKGCLSGPFPIRYESPPVLLHPWKKVDIVNIYSASDILLSHAFYCD